MNINFSDHKENNIPLMFHVHDSWRGDLQQRFSSFPWIGALPSWKTMELCCTFSCFLPFIIPHLDFSAAVFWVMRCFCDSWEWWGTEVSYPQNKLLSAYRATGEAIVLWLISKLWIVWRESTEEEHQQWNWQRELTQDVLGWSSTGSNVHAWENKHRLWL